MVKTKAPVKEVVKEVKKETKESKLIALLSGKSSFTVNEIVAKIGYSLASATMYTSQSYLDRKGKKIKVVESMKGKEKAFRYEVKK